MMPTHPYERILVVKLSAIGDIIHTLPAVAALRRAYPKAWLAWLVERAGAELLRGNQDLDEIVVIDTQAWRANWRVGFRHAWYSTRHLRRARFDLCIDFQGLLKSALFTFFSGAPLRLGFPRPLCREPLSALFTNLKGPQSDSEVHIVDQQVGLLQALGIQTPERHFPIPITEADERFATRVWRELGFSPDIPIVVLNPGAAWATKRWGEENFAHLSDALVRRYRAKTLLTWGPGEETRMRRVAQAMSYRAAIAPPTTLLQLAALLSRCTVFVGGDTGPLHLAAAVGTPTVALFGPSNPRRNGPYGPGHVVLHRRLPCSDCYQRTCDHWECLPALEVESVLQAVGGLLDKASMRKE
ncbi:MAG: lipopolysaccharide heptosyltransferase I [Nitrospinae bacterium]|nr:lipopolysaccharide heptosyltransferase I [Nitrospinota bacterium]